MDCRCSRIGYWGICLDLRRRTLTRGWRKLHKEKLHVVYASSTITAARKWTLMRRVGYVTTMWSREMFIGLTWWQLRERRFYTCLSMGSSGWQQSAVSTVCLSMGSSGWQQSAVSTVCLRMESSGWQQTEVSTVCFRMASSGWQQTAVSLSMGSSGWQQTAVSTVCLTMGPSGWQQSAWSVSGRNQVADSIQQSAWSVSGVGQLGGSSQHGISQDGVK